MGKNTISKKVKATRRHGLSNHRNNGGERDGREGSQYTEEQVALFNRMQEPGNFHRYLQNIRTIEKTGQQFDPLGFLKDE